MSEWLKDTVVTVMVQIDEIERLRAALKRYGGHDKNCDSFWPGKKRECTCGLTEILTSHKET